MNRILTLGVLALGLILGSQQQASAWCNFKFGQSRHQRGLPVRQQLFPAGDSSTAAKSRALNTGCGGCPGGCPSLYMNYGGGPGPGYYAGAGYGGAAYAGMPGYGPNYGPGAAGGQGYANGPQQSQQTPAAATGNGPQKTPATTIPNYQSGQTPYQPTSNTGGYPTNYQGAYPGGYGYNPYGSNSNYGGGHNYGTQPAYNGWNWNMGYGK